MTQDQNWIFVIFFGYVKYGCFDLPKILILSNINMSCFMLSNSQFYISLPLSSSEIDILCLKVSNWPTTLHAPSATAQKKTYLIHLNKFLMWLLTGNDFFLENQKVGWASTSFLLLYKWPWYTRNWVYFTIFIRTLCPTLHLWLGDLKSIPKLVERFFFFALEFFGKWWRSETKNILHFLKKWFEILIFLNNFFVEITFTWK